ncbi:zf-HC2 domain-containing protein [Streptomyces sp. NPDC002490]|uniref:zf-HC2 domain-containing protein n=1 Tax=Streptomyces sp. NPDC002490 TaxID=3154416 RepID=UPI0033200E2E
MNGPPPHPCDLSELWQRIDRATDEPTRSPLERCALRLGVPEHLTRLCAAMPALRRSWWGGAALLVLLTVALARWSSSPSAPLPFLALVPALSALAVAAVAGPRFDPAYVWLAVSPRGGFRTVLLRAAAVQALGLPLGAVAAAGLPLPFPHLFGWLVPSLMLTAVCLALSSRMDVARAVALTLTAWAGWLVVGHQPELPAGTRVLLPAAQLAMAAVTLLAVGALIALRDGFDGLDRPRRTATGRTA